MARVSAVFANNGAGVRGDLKAVVRAILLDPEARAASVGPHFGKLREPVLRLTALLRAFNARSDSGQVLMTATDDPATRLGQTPLTSPSVFNFFRPGHVPPGGEAAALGLTLPEMQITTETSVAGYTNFMIDVLNRGAGPRGLSGTAARPDLQLNYTDSLALATQPAALVDRVCARLLGDGAAGAALKADLVQAVSSLAVPALKADRSNLAIVERAKLNRVRIATLLVLASPDFIVQK